MSDSWEKFRTVRVENYTKFAANLSAFADRQAARPCHPDRTLDHIIEPARRAAEQAALAAEAYRSGDKAAAEAARTEYAYLMMKYSFLQGIDR